jgi:hypothetical protein
MGTQFQLATWQAKVRDSPYLLLQFSSQKEEVRLLLSRFRRLGAAEVLADKHKLRRACKSRQSLCIALLVAKARYLSNRVQISDSFTVEETRTPGTWVCSLADALHQLGSWQRNIFGGSATAREVINVIGGRDAQGRFTTEEGRRMLRTPAEVVYHSRTVPIGCLTVVVGAPHALEHCQELTEEREFLQLAELIKNQVREWRSIPLLEIRPPERLSGSGAMLEGESPRPLEMRHPGSSTIPILSESGPTFSTITLEHRELERRRSVYARVLGADGWRKTMRNIHRDHKLLPFYGSSIPVTILHEAEESQWGKTEWPLAKPIRGNDAPAPDEYSPHFDPLGRTRFKDLQALQKSDPGNYFNGETFELAQVDEVTSGYLLRCRKGRYFPAAATCDVLIDEFINTHSRNPNMGVRFSALPRREWLRDNAGVPNIVFSGNRRAAAIGVSTLVVFFDAETKRYRFFMHPRSKHVQVYQHLYHVIPSAMFQPLVASEGDEDEFNLELNIFREFYEELYNAKEAKRRRGEVNAGWILNRRPVVRLREMLECKGNYSGQF